MDTLKSMFPDLDVSTLQATLDAHEGSVERTVDYLLSSHSVPNDQERRDAELALRLQQEEDNAANVQHRDQQQPTGGNMTNTESDAFTLPSLAQVQSAVQPLVNSVAYAGRVAATSVSGLYRELVGDENNNNTRPNQHQSSNDHAEVVRNDNSTSSPTRLSARQRRPESSSISRSFGDKKDD